MSGPEKKKQTFTKSTSHDLHKNIPVPQSQTACYQNKVSKQKSKQVSKYITGCATATSCCISDVLSQWESQKFDPHCSHIFQPIFLKLKTKKDIWDTILHAKFG